MDGRIEQLHDQKCLKLEVILVISSLDWFKVSDNFVIKISDVPPTSIKPNSPVSDISKFRSEPQSCLAQAPQRPPRISAAKKTCSPFLFKTLWKPLWGVRRYFAKIYPYLVFIGGFNTGKSFHYFSLLLHKKSIDMQQIFKTSWAVFWIHFKNLIFI